YSPVGLNPMSSSFLLSLNSLDDTNKPHHSREEKFACQMNKCSHYTTKPSQTPTFLLWESRRQCDSMLRHDDDTTYRTHDDFAPVSLFRRVRAANADSSVRYSNRTGCSDYGTDSPSTNGDRPEQRLPV